MNRQTKYNECVNLGTQIADKCYSDNTYIEWKNNTNGNIPYSIISDYIKDELNTDKFDRYEFNTIKKTFVKRLQHLIESNTNYQTKVTIDIPFCTTLSITDTN